ncbi:metallophosphoesterase family protein [Paraburkholderia oxyphila]|uniref:metallophosphoesterase family protein n=1 Tax=Paraburkholderia oxyphila TaxID=614212 RepID=UPI000693F934|nr:metallophosphoesterase [Paraburkholderia oxyphila]
MKKPAPLANPQPGPDQLNDLRDRLLNAIAAIRASQSSNPKMIDFLLNQAQNQTNALVSGDTNSSPDHHILANIRSLLMNAQVLPTTSDGLAVSSISDEGDIVGNGKYESLDIGWTEAAVCWLEYIASRPKAPFQTNPPEISIDATLSIAVAGDWGTGFDYRPDGLIVPAEKVKNCMTSCDPVYTVHLGDVYYSGTLEEEPKNFIDLWPEGVQGSFTLNSNHEMYSGANGYFAALGDDKFSKQNKNSYFALKNQDWLIVGLDTAYHADELHLYQHGFLDSDQCAFLDRLLNEEPMSRRTILLTHHNGLSLDGSTPTALWGQIAPSFAQRELWWYWGHLHAGVVYADRGKVHGRCCGHGAFPAGEPDSLVGNPSAIWHENRKVPDLLYPGRIHNGFVLLSLDGPALTETFIDEDGATVYTQFFPPV